MVEAQFNFTMMEEVRVFPGHVPHCVGSADECNDGSDSGDLELHFEDFVMV